jgi:hypothetical protein
LDKTDYEDDDDEADDGDEADDEDAAEKLGNHKSSYTYFINCEYRSKAMAT